MLEMPNPTPSAPHSPALDAAAIFSDWHTAHKKEPPTERHHGLIAYASCQLEADASNPAASRASQAWLLPAEKLAALEALLRGMQPANQAAAPAVQSGALSPAHERALASLMGLVDATGKPPADGLIPWAALEASLHKLEPARPETGWAWITPCHWAMGMGQATFTHPVHLPALIEADSRCLLEAMRPYWTEDGITLHYSAAHRWLAEGAIFQQLPTASLDQVMGQSVESWLPAGTPAVTSKIRRLQGEMQMLLYTHPVNDARSEKRQLPINSFWISGTGDLPMSPAQAIQAAAIAATIEAPRSLAVAFQTGNTPAFAEAWQAIDTELIARLLKNQREGQSVQLTLCGLRKAQSYTSRPKGLKSTIQGIFNNVFGISALSNLHKQL